jgi:N-acetylneuraminic acid mutarotase
MLRLIIVKYIKCNIWRSLVNFTKYSSHLALSGFIFTLVLFFVFDNEVYPLTNNKAINVNFNSSYWEIGQNMSSARNELAAVLLDNKIYVIGGENIAAGGSQKDTLDVYDTVKGKWIEDNNIAQMPASLDHTAAATYDGKIYVVGGFHERKTPTDKLYIYDPEKNEWEEGTPLPSPSGALTADFINGTLYAIGGLNSSHIPTNTNEAYDPKTNSWTTKSQMPTARHHISSAVIDGKLFVVGGRILGNGVMSEDIDEALSNFDRNEVYDPKSDSWEIREPMLVKRSGFTAAAYNGNLYVFGGEGIGEVYDSVEKYDPGSNAWTFEAPLPTGRMGLKAVPVDDRIYVIGGRTIDQSGLVPLNVNEILYVKNDK